MRSSLEGLFLASIENFYFVVQVVSKSSASSSLLVNQVSHVIKAHLPISSRT